MTSKLPEIIKNYVDASNEHDVKSILACFSDFALVRDEAEEFHGKKVIESWIVKTIEKYNFKFKPLTVKDDGGHITVSMEVSGTFDGSPVIPDYRFSVKDDKILSLTIE